MTALTIPTFATPSSQSKQPRVHSGRGGQSWGTSPGAHHRRAGTPPATRISGGDRHIVELAHGQTPQCHDDPLVKSRACCRGADRKKGTVATGGVRGAVVDAIGREVRQGAPIGVRGRSRPRRIEDAEVRQGAPIGVRGRSRPRCIVDAVHRRAAHPQEPPENRDAGETRDANREPREAFSWRGPQASAPNRLFSTTAVQLSAAFVLTDEGLEGGAEGSGHRPAVTASSLEMSRKSHRGSYHGRLPQASYVLLTAIRSCAPQLRISVTSGWPG